MTRSCFVFVECVLAGMNKTPVFQHHQKALKYLIRCHHGFVMAVEIYNLVNISPQSTQSYSNNVFALFAVKKDFQSV
jgi:hypothetical protein